ncbi:SMP-30/Gluconolaconase/LRE-like region [Colletotrichum tamarilloi]|uniref:SMP-30/Gluconolaconase/LRE-like region n=1 Tax=Colletotrichum tamarilloi TaxID=1209934 RepID=A0ABQ9RC31_9PEZI|nr:SMP-30/Gluconolaconase/LRE-like region [Colletotrichum tamarilloi]KAK1500566.1 SMP-30/Gluconolaconase/LRE-like region [Colletotrichum tamarilloi]
MSSNTENLDSWQVHDDSFREIIGSSPSLDLLLQIDSYPFAHEAGVFIPSNDELFITSNQFTDIDGSRKVQISKISLPTGGKIVRHGEISCPGIAMGNGGVNYGDDILFCAQGSMTQPSGLFKMSRTPPYATEPVITSFHSRPFNSVNDVVVSKDGSIWFTDPPYGHEQGYRPPATLPSQVYRFDPATSSIRAMADGFGRPNGICFSPDERTVYVTDTDLVHGDGTIDGNRASTIYAFDVEQRHGQPVLLNKRLFAFADVGIPDGIKCDTNGNVYSGCGDGVNVWSPGGVLLGRILVDGGAANFCFGRGGELFILNEHRLWRAQLRKSVKGALLKI